MAAPPADDDELQSRSHLIRKHARMFCRSLAGDPMRYADFLIEAYFSPSNPRITEHGPEWAQSRLPFLGKTFRGREACLEYFRLLNDTLEMEVEPFPSEGAFAVDAEAHTRDEGSEEKGVVTVTGGGKFKSVKTGKEWEEKFVYRFSDFDEKGKIGHWEVWADPLSAWVAVGEDG